MEEVMVVAVVMVVIAASGDDADGGVGEGFRLMTL